MKFLIFTLVILNIFLGYSSFELGKEYLYEYETISSLQVPKNHSKTENIHFLKFKILLRPILKINDQNLKIEAKILGLKSEQGYSEEKIKEIESSLFNFDYNNQNGQVENLYSLKKASDSLILFQKTVLEVFSLNLNQNKEVF